MVDIALDLDPNSPTYLDVKRSDGDLVQVDGQAAILQDILTDLRTFLGEWFLDVTAGVDYYGQVLVKNPDQSKVDALFINRILMVPGVTQLNQFSITKNFATRQLFVAFSATTTQGKVDYSGLL